MTKTYRFTIRSPEVEALVEAAKNAFATLDNIMLHATATWPAPGGMTTGDIEGRTKILKGLHAALEPFDGEFQRDGTIRSKDEDGNTVITSSPNEFGDTIEVTMKR